MLEVYGVDIKNKTTDTWCPTTFVVASNADEAEAKVNEQYPSDRFDTFVFDLEDAIATAIQRPCKLHIEVSEEV